MAKPSADFDRPLSAVTKIYSREEAIAKWIASRLLNELLNRLIHSLAKRK